MKKQDEQFDQWVEYAKDRYEVKLMDGQEAVLVAVRQNGMSCKVLLDGRFYNCWVDDIALLRMPRRLRRQAQLASSPEDSFVEPSWFVLLPWQAPDLDQAPGSDPRLLRARPSKHWLEVHPNPRALHPAFQFPVPEAEVIPLHRSTSRVPRPAVPPGGHAPRSD